MKIEQSTGVRTHASQNTSSVQFTISNSASLFKTLIAGLYSDPVGSVAREIIANAVDAHAMSPSKPNKPVQVCSIPGNIETFSVRDFGPGMSHDFIMSLYTTLGHSEKIDTNEATGMFGLGAKSPFSLTDQFTIRTTQQGKTRTYVAHFDSNDRPALSYLGEADTSDAQGTEILIKSKHTRGLIENAHALARDVIALQDTEINNTKIPLRKASEYICQHDGQLIRVSTHEYHTTKLWIVQGTGLFPIDIKLLKNLEPKVVRFYNDSSHGERIVFHVPIGTVTVTPSREQLLYTVKTSEYIAKKLTSFQEQWATEFMMQIGNPKTLVESANVFFKGKVGDLSSREGYFWSTHLSGLLPPGLSRTFVWNIPRAITDKPIQPFQYRRLCLSGQIKDGVDRRRFVEGGRGTEMFFGDPIYIIPSSSRNYVKTILQFNEKQSRVEKTNSPVVFRVKDADYQTAVTTFKNNKHLRVFTLADIPEIKSGPINRRAFKEIEVTALHKHVKEFVNIDTPAYFLYHSPATGKVHSSENPVRNETGYGNIRLTPLSVVFPEGTYKGVPIYLVDVKQQEKMKKIPAFIHLGRTFKELGKTTSVQDALQILNLCVRTHLYSYTHLDQEVMKFCRGVSFYKDLEHFTEMKSKKGPTNDVWFTTFTSLMGISIYHSAVTEKLMSSINERIALITQVLRCGLPAPMILLVLKNYVWPTYAKEEQVLMQTMIDFEVEKTLKAFLV